MPLWLQILSALIISAVAMLIIHAEERADDNNWISALLIWTLGWPICAAAWFFLIYNINHLILRR